MWSWFRSRRPQPHQPDLRALYLEERKRWEQVNTSLVPVNRPRAEEAAKGLYTLAGVEPPRFLWCDSPPAFFEALFWTREQEPGREIWEDILAERQDLFQTLDELYPAERRVWWERDGALRTRWREQRRALERSPLLPAVERELRQRLPRLSFAAPPAGLETTFLTVFRLLPSYAELARGQVSEVAIGPLPERMRARLHHWRELAQTCWWWWPCETVCLFCARPTRLQFDDAMRLHGDRRSALQFLDGWQVYAWHVVLAPEEIVEHPETLTPARIDAEPNLELRRLMIAHFGESRYLEEVGGRLVHIDDWGALYRRETPGQEPMVMVRVKNSTPEPDGTFKTYRLRVPPWIDTAREAVAWTFGLSAEDYAPQQET